MNGMFTSHYWGNNYFPVKHFAGGAEVWQSVFVPARSGNVASAASTEAVARIGSGTNVAKFGPSQGTAKS